jgi:hypothetical protein
MSDDTRWSHLVNLAFLLRGCEGGAAPERSRVVLEAIDSALEVFPPETEPLEDFEGYAVRRLLLALRKTLGP